MQAGALRENTRRNESLDRGSVTVTGSATVTVAGTPGPIRIVTAAVACIQAADYDPTETAAVTIQLTGSNTFIIHCWDNAGVASVLPVTISWIAWGSLG